MRTHNVRNQIHTDELMNKRETEAEGPSAETKQSHKQRRFELRTSEDPHADGVEQEGLGEHEEYADDGGRGAAQTDNIEPGGVARDVVGNEGA